MSWFYNLKIAPKLLISFLLMALFAGAIGYVGISQIKSVAKADTRLYEKMTVPIMQLANLNRAFLEIRVNVRDLMIAASAVESQKYESNLRRLEQDIQSYQDEYQKSLFTKEETLTFEGFSAGVRNYFSDLEQFKNLIKSGDKKEALSFLRGHFLSVAQSIDSALITMRQYKIDMAKATSESNVSLSDKASATMIIFMAVGIAVAISLGFWIASIVGKPLSKMTETCNRIAVGDLDHLIELNSKDEVGALAEAFRKIIETQKALAGAAMRIAEGDLAVMIQQHSDKDILSKSILQVQQSLKGLVNETVTLTMSATEGQLNKRSDEKQFKGGYRNIIEGINNTLNAATAPINEALSVLEKVADRDLTARVTSDYKGDFAQFKDVLNKTVRNLEEALERVALGSEQVAAAAEQISSGSQSLSQSSSESASSLEEISSSLQEVSSMTRQNAVNAKEAQKLSESAHSSALKGAESMNRLSNAINEIKKSSDATAKIIKTIDEIAFQTNLLALNAAVEAARAGDAGKGFAVVAEEVRNLAMRSADAAKNTAALIEESVSKSEGGVAINQEVILNLHEINNQIVKVTEMIAEIAVASEQQNKGIEQVNIAVDHMNQVTQATAANAEESASSAEELASQAAEMQNMVHSFTIERVRNLPQYANNNGNSPSPVIFTNNMNSEMLREF
jgi:methyl-accepting chemotaxis protein